MLLEEKISTATDFRDMVGNHSIVDKVLSMYLLFLLLSERKYIITKNVGVSTPQAYSVFIHRDTLPVQKWHGHVRSVRMFFPIAKRCF